jgi:hypothetical protein
MEKSVLDPLVQAFVAVSTALAVLLTAVAALIQAVRKK